MLDQKTIEVIKSTVPVLEEHGEKITTHFYQTMFTNHPELLNIFNHANQKKGRQQAALANAVYAAAVHIDQLETILPVVKQIAHKHRSLGVKAEHYPIVGEHLLQAIKDVLQEAATEEILEAWAAAYGVIADIFISVEAEMYEQTEAQQGGWADFKPFVIERKVKESEVITSFYLKPVDGKILPPFSAGQYISVKLEIPGEQYTHIRQYSLSDVSGQDYYRISVKREDQKEPEGKVSTYLHQHLQEGDELLVSAPAGEFILSKSARPLVLISGGVGLTPLVSMLKTAVREQQERDVTFIHAAMDGKHHALRAEVDQLTAEHEHVRAFYCYEQPASEDPKYDKAGYIDEEWLQTIIEKKNADFYFCGPVGFMKTVDQILTSWGINEEQKHYEFFGPAMKL
ncbi:NO-inducible flavohemoprotein [Alkalihalobacillus oceani]|uniref:NO-inducible flavohemoprotein n=1 Tax=Halalkalibacter oceani TaxID=1653776 RepID=UPI00203F3724|nr:NO-inducible flavohemoprotein [Halalkalibacter oceani]MCM3762489.1 NO-inducible flavohemoprotein [Halalkalibacter oceani]